MLRLTQGASPGAVLALTRMNAEIDVRPILATIRVPTMVLDRLGDRVIPVGAGRFLAKRIPNASFVQLAGDDHLPWIGDTEAVLGEIEFLTGVRTRPEANRVLATVLFTDIVGSTQRAAELGDAARAIRCALALVKAVRPLGLEIRAGLHTGEVEMAGDEIEGLAIHIGARIAALAGTGEVLVSRTIKDLVVGSGLTFHDRGMHALKGVPDQWQLFATAIN